MAEVVVDQDYLPAERETVIEQLPAEMGRPVGSLTKRDVLEAKEQIALWKEFKLALLSVTTNEDWVDQDGHPYLKDSGIHKVAQVTHLEFGDPAVEREDGEDAKGKWTAFSCRMKATCRGRSTGDEGYASTKDKFFSVKNKTPVPYEDINIGNVRKKAITNAQHRLLMKLLAFGGLAWEDLKPFGIVPTESVRYRGNEQRAATGAGKWTPLKNHIWGLLLELAGGDIEGAGNRLHEITENKEKNFAGKRDPVSLTDNQATWVMKRVAESWKKAYGQEPPPMRAGGQDGPPPPEAREPGADG